MARALRTLLVGPAEETLVAAPDQTVLFGPEGNRVRHEGGRCDRLRRAAERPNRANGKSGEDGGGENGSLQHEVVTHPYGKREPEGNTELRYIAGREPGRPR